MISLLEAKKDVPLVVKTVVVGGRDRSGRGGRGRGRGIGIGRGRNRCRRISDMGIREGAIIKKLSVQPFFGPIIIRIGNCEIAIGRGIASSILVEEVKN